MALDPNIALQLKPIQTNFAENYKLGVDTLARQQEIAASKATQANVEAQLPGIVAESAQKEITTQQAKNTQNARQEIIDNPKDFQNADGTPDYVKISHNFAKHGDPTSGLAIASTDLANQKVGISNAADNVDLGAKVGKYVNSGVDHAMNILLQTPPELQQVTNTQLRKTLIHATPGTVTDANGVESNPMINENNYPSVVTPGYIKARTDATISPEMRKSQEMTQEGIDTAKAQQKLNDDLAKGKDGTLDSGVRAEYAVKRNTLNNTNDVLTAGFNSALILQQDPGMRGTLESVMSKQGANEPNRQSVEAGVAAYNINHPNAQITGKMGMDTVTRMLKADYSNNVNTIGTISQIINPGPGGKPGTPQPTETAQPVATGNGSYAPVTEANFKQGGPKLNLPPHTPGFDSKHPGSGLTATGENKPTIGKTPIVTSQAQYDKLSKGDHYVDANGNPHTKK